ncbi:hypothetical protein BgiBS90_023709 [Biomphalaria glabrata]|nr:hypothetical protein BgiBS90_023709 [Biomphalaria glabrata]
MNELPVLQSLVDEASTHLNGSVTSQHTSYGNSTFLSYDLQPVSSELTHSGMSEHANHIIFDPSRSGHYSSSARSALHQKYATTRQFPSFYSPWGLGYSQDGGKSNTIGPNSIHLSQLQQYLSSSVPRHRIVDNGYLEMEQKESSISLFDIETDKISSFQYRPGEEIHGTINIFVKNSLNIRFVELIVVGKGLFTVQRSRGELPLKLKETYLRKKKCVIGSRHGWNVVLPRGKYATKFRIHLPKDLPSTVHYEDAVNGFLCDVSYSIEARICDNSRYMKGNTSQPLPKVLCSKQIAFNVQRSFDLARLPTARTPLTHTEQLSLSRCHNEVAVVTVQLERAVFLAGDDVRFQLNINMPSHHGVRKVFCSFQEQITFGAKQESVTITLSSVNSYDEKKLPRTGEVSTFSVALPTSLDLVSPLSLVPSQTKINYFLSIKINFSPTSGRLTFKVPVLVGPCADPIYAEKNSSRKIIPIFHRPTRFPTFSHQAQTSQPAFSMDLSTPSQDSKPIKPPDRIETKFKSGFLSCFMCCLIRDDIL